MKNKKHQMPDYKPKDIPILEDIIETGTVDDDQTAEEVVAGPDNAAAKADAFDINLFLAKSTEETEYLKIDEPAPALGDLNSILDTAADSTDEILHDFEESTETGIFLYDESAENHPDDSIPLPTDYYADEENESEPVIDNQYTEPAPQVLPEPIAVGKIVKDIIREMMPDLEQQLVFMLQKAIEEKLPKELIKSPDTDHESDQQN